MRRKRRPGPRGAGWSTPETLHRHSGLEHSELRVRVACFRILTRLRGRAGVGPQVGPTPDGAAAQPQSELSDAARTLATAYPQCAFRLGFPKRHSYLTVARPGVQRSMLWQGYERQSGLVMSCEPP
jgi:hypothetical protein